MMFKQHNETSSYNLEFWGIRLGGCTVITVYFNAFTKKVFQCKEATIENLNNYQKPSTEDIETKLKQLDSLKAKLLEKL